MRPQVSEDLRSAPSWHDFDTIYDLDDVIQMNEFLDVYEEAKGRAMKRARGSL